MSVERIIVGFVIVVLPALSFSAEEVVLDENRSIMVSLKEGWEITPTMAPPGLPAKTIHMTKEGQRIMLTLIGSKDGSPIIKSSKELEHITVRASQQYVSSSVEGQVNLRTVSETNLVGSYASFTDKTWVNKKPPAGSYACVTSGTFIVDGIVAAVTYLSSDLESTAYKEGLSIIKSLKGKS